MVTAPNERRLSDEQLIDVLDLVERDGVTLPGATC
jgi:hypothetical protein